MRPALLRLVPLLGAVGLALAGSGCATRQAVPLECVPERAEIFVDKRLVEGNPDLLQLDPDRPHVVMVRAPGYETQLFTLEPAAGGDGAPRLEPERLCVELVPVGQGRDLEIEIDAEAPASPPRP